MKKLLSIIFLGLFLNTQAQLPLIKIADNKRSFCTGDNQPFFWMGDTGWLLFVKLKREEAIQYLEDRKKKGFNVIQVMLIHNIKLAVNAYGDSALLNNDVATPKTSPGNSFNDAEAYDFWDNVDYVINEAAKRGIYMALVPVWGANIKFINELQAKKYAAFIANRFKNKTNIIWLNGGDIKGSDAVEIWNSIGNTIRSIDKNHLIGFHPRGRNSSATWFHLEPWLDFNMFQSGHRSYDQDTSFNETLHYGEDNWRYVQDDYQLLPTKPTFDGEPSYEGIPHGLHDGTQPYWRDDEVRRYAYWSVFAGSCGFTYGHNAVMQFYSLGNSGISFFPKITWQKGLSAPGAGQMQYLKKLMLSKSYFDRIPNQSLVADNGERYERVLATSGKNYALLYVYNGRSFSVAIDQLKFPLHKASWYNPKNGKRLTIAMNQSTLNGHFNPPGERTNGNDWILILEK